MINELFGEAVLNLFIGVLIGIIWEWNEKIFYGLFIIGLILAIVGIIIIGNPYGVEYPWWRTLFGVFFMVIGIECGKFIGRNKFKK